jgi:ABC-type oligopeptide transport system substrate-binding subunit
MGLQIFLPHLQHLRAQWKETLGVTISWQLVDSQALWDRLLGPSPQLLAAGHLADYPDPDSFFRDDTAQWCVGRRNKDCERLIEAARRVTDQRERMRLLRQVDRILVEEARIIPLTHDPHHHLLKPWVTRYPTSAMILRFWKDVVIEPH